MSGKLDLNYIELRNNGDSSVLSDEPIEDLATYVPPDDCPSAPSHSVPHPHVVEAITSEPEWALDRAIYEADAVVGCIAWLTSETILERLAGKEAVSIVVQKEDFLRPDLDPGVGWKRRLRRQYEALPSGFHRDDETFYRTDLPERSANRDTTIQAIRCCGVTKSDPRQTRPCMHHKFLVFLERDPTHTDANGRTVYFPKALWTGSFNPTRNGTKSLENAVLITADNEWYFKRESLPQFQAMEPKEKGNLLHEFLRHHVPHTFFQEWAHVLALSEPLNWTSDYVAPEWRLHEGEEG